MLKRIIRMKLALLILSLLLLSLVALGSGRAAPVVPELAQSLPQIGVDEVHRLGITGRGVGILVIDSFTPPPSDPFPHGEWVAGIAGAVAPEAVVWRVNLEGFTTVEGRWSYYDSELRDALTTALREHREKGIRVINMSLGGGRFTAPCSFAPDDGLLYEIQELIRQLAADGVILIAASGNDAWRGAMRFPACLPEVVSVGAVYDYTSSQPERTEVCEAYPVVDGITCYSDRASFLDLLAPGSIISVPHVVSGGGTSAAAPHVAGVTALLLEVDPDLTGPELVDLLRETGVQIAPPRDEISFGLTFPRVDALAAVQRLIAQSKKAEITLQEAWLAPETVMPGEAVTVTVALRNRGDAPGTFPIVIRADGAVVVDVEAAVEAEATVTLSYQLFFPQPGSYEITLDVAEGEQLIGVVEVSGGELGAICSIAGMDKLVDGADLIGAIQAYARGELGGADLIRVIQYYATKMECDRMLSALNIGLIAPQGVVEVELTGDRTEIRPGGELEVTARLTAREKITGLLLRIELPSGWELFPVDNGDATTFKQRSREWLWIDVPSSAEKEIRFRVQAAADALPGDYEIGGRVMTAVPELDFALTPLTVQIAGEPVEFKVEDVTVIPSPVTSAGAEFKAEGTGILKLEARVYSIEGKLLFEGSADGSTLAFPAVDLKGRPLANGVYLYHVTVRGVDEGLWQSEVRKLIILR